MDINAQFINKTNSPALPVKENMLILDPLTSNTVAGGATTTWDIPTASGANGSYIDFNSSYLEVTYNPKTGDARLPIGGVHSLVDVIDVESSNFVVEHTDNWSRLRSALSDVNDTNDDRMGIPAACAGLSGTYEGALDSTEVDATTKVLTSSLCSVSVPSRKGESRSKDSSARYCVPIPSQQLNYGSHLPIWAISKLRYSITWAANLDGVVTSGTTASTGYELSDIKLHLCYLEMSNKSRDVISSKSGLSWSHPMWEVHKANTVASAASQSFRYPSHKSSVKTLMCSFHNPEASNKGTQDVDATSRCKNGIESFQYRINGEYYPQNEIKCDLGGNAALLELNRAFHKVKSNSGQITKANWTSSDTTTAGCTFLIATNTETNTGRSNASFGGVSTLQEAPLLLCKFSTGSSSQLSANVGAAEVLMYVQYDGANTIREGVWRVDN